VTWPAIALSPVHPWGDSKYTLYASEHLLRTGRVDLDVAQLSGALQDRPPYQLESIGSRVYLRYPIGTVVLAAPLVFMFNRVGISTIDATGKYDERSEKLMEIVIASLVTAATAVVWFCTARLLVPSAAAWLIALGAVFGTPVWSGASRILSSHPFSLLITSVVLLWLVGRSVRGWRVNHAVLAALLVMAFTARPTAATSILGVLVLVALSGMRNLGLLVTGLVAAGSVFVGYSLLYSGQLLPTYYLPGPTELIIGDQPLDRFLGELVSPSRGLLWYAPIVVFVVIAAMLTFRRLRHPTIACASLFAIGAHLALMTSHLMWWGGHTYGARIAVDLVPWTVLLAVLLLHSHLSRDRRLKRSERWGLGTVAATAILVLSVTVNARGALSWDTHYWNVDPTDVDRHQERLWDWSDPQALARGRAPAAQR
jgi:hypothetical protein